MTVDQMEELIDSQPVAFIGSVDGEGFPNMKAMLAPRLREGLRVFYFTTNTSSRRVAQYRLDPKAAVYFCDPGAFVGIQLRGEMQVLEDAASRRLIWREGDTEYYPLGIDDPDYCVLRFTARHGRVYGAYHSDDFEI